MTEFTPGGLLVSNTKVLVARKDLPANTLAEFIAYARANQAKMQYGSAGGGSATHIACVLLNAKMGTSITHVPYRGTGPALQDLMAGRIDFMCEVISTALPQIRGDTIKAIATMSATRAAVLPDVPTTLEQGLADVDANGWNGFLPQGHAGRDRPARQRGDRRDPRHARRAQAHRGPRPVRGAAGRAQPRVPRPAGGLRAREMGPADPGRRRQRRLIADIHPPRPH